MKKILFTFLLSLILSAPHSFVLQAMDTLPKELIAHIVSFANFPSFAQYLKAFYCLKLSSKPYSRALSSTLLELAQSYIKTYPQQSRLEFIQLLKNHPQKNEAISAKESTITNIFRVIIPESNLKLIKLFIQAGIDLSDGIVSSIGTKLEQEHQIRISIASEKAKYRERVYLVTVGRQKSTIEPILNDCSYGILGGYNFLYYDEYHLGTYIQMVSPINKSTSATAKQEISSIEMKLKKAINEFIGYSFESDEEAFKKHEAYKNINSLLVCGANPNHNVPGESYTFIKWAEDLSTIMEEGKQLLTLFTKPIDPTL